MTSRVCSRTLLAAGCIALLLVAARVGTSAADKSAAAMATAANQFLQSLTPDQRQKAAYAFDSAERMKFHFIPTEMFARNGLTIGEMTEAQRKLAHAMLQAGLSQRGYMTATGIMDLERILAALEGPGGKLVRDPVRYFFAVFGTPGPKGAWGWRAEGHHISLSFTVVNGSFVNVAPAFFGTNPAEVRDGEKKGLRILGAEEDAARALVTALDESQRAKAIFNATAPNDIATMNTLDISPLTPGGIASAELNQNQRAMLMKVIETYTSQMAPDIAADRTARLQKAGVDKITFAWAGPIERGQRHYYRVQGPTFLIEYDNTQNNGNHVHSVWRDFQGDFGRDLLREHLKATAH
jgi:hypothetical protein